MRHNSSLVCMVRIASVYINTIYTFYGYILFFLYPSLLLRWMFEHDCLHTCLQACILYFCICTCSAQLSIFHKERCSRNTHYNYYFHYFNLRNLCCTHRSKRSHTFGGLGGGGGGRGPHEPGDFHATCVTFMNANKTISSFTQHNWSPPTYDIHQRFVHL